MKRSELREHLFLMLFRNDFYEREELKDQALMYLEYIQSYTESLDIPEQIIKAKDEDYLLNRFLEIADKVDKIDALIEEASTGWKLNRIGKAELTIMRLAVFEMKFDEEIPTGVAINEAVELAKRFGKEDSSGFVNGLLAKLA